MTARPVPGNSARHSSSPSPFQLSFPSGRGVAQPGSALAWGARGRKFESCRPDQYLLGPVGQREWDIGCTPSCTHLAKDVITTPTVLILGAGASAPRGFPTGWQLLAQARAQELHGLAEMIKPVPATSAPALLQAIAGTGERSLDAMLEHRPPLVEAGKALMARALLYKEESALASRQDSQGEWYRELWAAMSASSLQSFRRNQLTILTYNYDRSLEYFLITALCERFQKSRLECAAMLDCIGPFHLHGQLGLLPELSPRRTRTCCLWLCRGGGYKFQCATCRTGHQNYS